MTSTGRADRVPWRLVFAAWIVAVLSTLGSLFFSEVMDLAPCVLCWYQRIFMFPLAVTLAVGLIPFDLGSIKYSLPLAIGGACFALYHCLVFVGLIPESIQPCAQGGISCGDTASQSLGVIPIPLLSLIAFSAIVALLVAARKGFAK